MRLRRLITLLLALGLAGALTTVIVAEGGEVGGEPDMMTAMQEAMERAGALNEHHAHLKTMVGRWNVDLRHYMAPGSPPQEMKGAASMEMVLGDHFLHQLFKGDWMGQPFVGMGYDGYDNMSGKHQSIWMDSASTAAILMQGDCSEDGKVVTLYGERLDPLTQTVVKMKGVSTTKSASVMTYEAWDSSDGGETWTKMMEIIYTRQS